MEYFARSGKQAPGKTGCAIVGVFEDTGLTASGNAVDKAAGGALASLIESGDFAGRAGQCLLVTSTPIKDCARFLLVGLGKASEFNTDRYRAAAGAAAKALSEAGAADALWLPAGDEPAGLSVYTATRHAVEAMEAAAYRFDELKSKKPKPGRFKRVGFLVSGRGAKPAAERGIRDGKGIAEGQDLARTLANRPPNVCTPSHLATVARGLAREHKSLSATIYDEAQIRKMGMGAFLSVTAGSRQPAKLIVLKHAGGEKSDAPVVLVGKGITFDTGGVSLKPPLAMDEMKFDMGGAAGVIGAMASVARLNLPLNVIAVVPTCENMPDGNATRPGDVVRTMSGQTVEILNTDAEGRLILCDALTFSKRFKPAAVIDVATLTGACVIALGHHMSGLMSTDDALAEELLAAGRTAADSAWRLPVTEEYDRELKSNFADFPNVTGREGGAITAACFLSRFTKDMSWAHLDIAGTAWRTGSQKGATGRPVPLLVQMLMDRAGSR
jgi:leucyl aminopeptidase